MKRGPPGILDECSGDFLLAILKPRPNYPMQCEHFCRGDKNKRQKRHFPNSPQYAVGWRLDEPTLRDHRPKLAAVDSVRTVSSGYAKIPCGSCGIDARLRLALHECSQLRGLIATRLIIEKISMMLIDIAHYCCGVQRPLPSENRR